MNKDYTHFTMVTDRSGSMSNQWTDVQGGYKEFITEHKAESEKKGGGKCTFSLVGFDHEYTNPVLFEDIKNVSDEIPFIPRGSTALRDALGRAIVETGEELAKLDEAERPEKVIFVVQTDGYENASSEFDSAKIGEMIKEQRETYNWEFIFLGAGEAAIAAQGTSMGMNVNSTVAYAARNIAQANTMTLGKSINARRSASMADAKEQLTYSAFEKKSLVE